MKVVGTAGHIDHGKSTLVQRLTGIDPDRLEEEKRRGMTIDLGFAWLTLPSGRQISIVDVPGHERFIKNMLAGAAGIDVALVVIAADEGIMPQTTEHLDILDLLGVRHGVVALTKSDLVDEEWIALVREDVNEVLRGRSLQFSPVVPVSTVTDRGLEDLIRELGRVVEVSDVPPNDELPYLPADRIFSVRGFGTVVTGTLHGGGLFLGDEVEILPAGKRARIRGLQNHGENWEQAFPGSRVAVNLAGATISDITRGSILAKPGAVRAVRRVDCWLRVLKDATLPVTQASRVSVHVGSAERSATISVLSGSVIDQGKTGWIQLHFDEPVAVIRGQHFILRMPAPARTIAGGVVVDVAPRHRRSDTTALKRLEGLVSKDVNIAVAACLAGKKPMRARDLSVLLGVGLPRVQHALDVLEESGVVRELGEWHVAAADWSSLVQRVVTRLESFHALYPLRRGMPKQELARAAGWSGALWSTAADILVREGVLRHHDGSIALPAHTGGVEGRRDEANLVVESLRAHGFSPPSGSELRAALGTDNSFLAALVEEGIIVRVDDELYFARDTYEEMRRRVLDMIRRKGHVTVASVRDDLGTSRKYALALMEHLDGTRETKRMGDVRVLGGNAR